MLGDLFDFWAGDDDRRYPQEEVSHALRLASDSGCKLFVITGNRDFLISKDFSKLTGLQILPELYVVTINSEKFLLTHGDLLCTKDVSYQIFRKVIQNQFIKSTFLLLPLGLRMKLVQQTKKQTKKSVTKKTQETMDVEQATVIKLMTQHDASYMIHGHTHLAGIHQFEHNGQKMTRVVLGDWEGCGSIFVVHNEKKKLITAQNLIDQIE